MDMYEKRKQRKNKKEEMNNVEQNQTKTNINWYPGHMSKAIREIRQSLTLIDIVVEVLDSRIPISSSNPIISDLAQNKKKIVVLNKVDMADKECTLKWKIYFQKQGITAILMNASSGENIKGLIEAIQNLGKEIFEEKYKDKKILMTPIYRVMIAGIPNVGKSTIINKLAKRNIVNVGNKPGVTLKKQWIRIAGNIDLLDTPGLLWPRLDDTGSSIYLALTGNIKQEILDLETLAIKGIEIVKNKPNYVKLLTAKYKLQEQDLEKETTDLLELIGRKRGCLVAGNEVDLEKTSKIFLDDLKDGKIGNITLEQAKDIL